MWARVNRQAFFFEFKQGFEVHVFDFDGQHVNRFAEGINRVEVADVAIGERVAQLGCRSICALL